MSEVRKKADWPFVLALVAAGLLLAAGGVYIGGYFAMSRVSRVGFPTRNFNAKWQAEIYEPMVEIESMMRGEKLAPAWKSTTPPDESLPEKRPR